MRRVTVYVEGATRGKGKNESANIELRKAFAELARKIGVAHRPTFVSCGGRSQTWDVAWSKFLSRGEDELILLLVDSEDLTRYQPPEAWKHLRERHADRWIELEERHGPYVFMMVVAMETWLIADKSALERFFGTSYKARHIPNWPNLEQVTKQEVFKVLAAATSNEYDKGETSFRVLAEVHPTVVASSCPHCAYFCDRLKEICT